MDSEPLRLVVDAQQPAQAVTTIEQLTAACRQAVTSATSLGDAARAQLGHLSAIPQALREIDARTDALRASVDPLANAMKRANAELAEASSLYKLGAIAAAEYERYTGVLEARIETTTAAQAALNAMQMRGAAAAKLTSHEMLNLSRQAADVGVSLAMGMSPLMVMVAQGPQIAETFKMAGDRGLGFSAAMRQVAVSTWAAVAPLLPFIAAAAAVSATVGGGFALATKAINDTGDSTSELQRRLGLTSDQMKKLEKDGVSLQVTMGDVFRGTMKVAGEEFAKLGDFIWGFIGGPLTEFGRFLGGVWDDAVAGAVQFVRGMVGNVGAAIGGLKAVLPSLPAAVGDAAVSAVNAAIRSVVGLLNRAIGYVNVFIARANEAAKAVGLSIELPKFSAVVFAGIDNQFEGAGERAMRKFAEGAKRGQAEALAGLDGVVSYVVGLGARVRDAAGGFRDSRVLDGAGDAKAIKGGDAKSADELAGSLERFSDWMKTRNALAAEYAAILKSMAGGLDLAGGDAGDVIRKQAEAYAYAAELMAGVDSQVQDAARGMAGAFGKVGTAIGDVTSLMSRYAARQAELMAARRAEGVTVQQVALIDRAAARDRIALYGDLLGAARGFVDEQSDAYRALQAAEAGYRAWQMATSIQAMVQAQVESAAKVQATMTAVAAHTTAAGATMAADAATTSTGIAAGAARIFAQLGPWAFPVVAAMMGVMASLGASGSGGATGPSISEDRQRLQGTGSVLGDAGAQSESIRRSLETVAGNSNADLEYSNGMLRALRSIDSQISVVAAALARSFSAGGMLDTSGLGLGTTVKGPGLGQTILFGALAHILPGLFGSKTTRTLLDQGVQFDSASLAQIMNGGLTGAAYQLIESTTKKRAFGLTYSEKTKQSTVSSALDADFLRQTELLIGSLRDGVLAAAGVLGVQGAEATLAAFTVNLGKLSLKGMTGSEIQSALEGVFGKLADDMAGAVLPALAGLQKVGEGLFETLTRTARTYQVVDVSLASIGKTFGQVGVGSLEARQRLVDLFGGLDDFADATASYAEDFLTEAERLAPIQAAVTAELSRLGLAGLKTKDQFKATVAGLDLSTAAGAELYASLMALAPAFAKITAETEAVRLAKDNLAGAYERERDTLGETVSRYRDLAAGLGEYRRSLYSGPTAALSPEAAYQAAQSEFARVAGLAAGGDAAALGKIQGVSEAYLQASKDYYASSAGYFADLARVREAVTAAEGLAGAQADVAVQQLDELKSLVSGFMDVNESVLSVRDAITALQTAQGTPVAAPASSGSANDNSALVARLEAMEARLGQVVAELATANAQLAAGNIQRGAIYTAQAEQSEEEMARLERRLRDLSA